MKIIGFIFSLIGLIVSLTLSDFANFTIIIVCFLILFFVMGTYFLITGILKNVTKSISDEQVKDKKREDERNKIVDNYFKSFTPLLVLTSGDYIIIFSGIFILILIVGAIFLFLSKIATNENFKKLNIRLSEMFSKIHLIEKKQESLQQTNDILLSESNKNKTMLSVVNKITKTLNKLVAQTKDEKLIQYLSVKTSIMLSQFKKMYYNLNEISINEVTISMNNTRLQLKDSIENLNLHQFNEASTPIRKIQLARYIKNLEVVLNDRNSTANHIRKRYLQISQEYMIEQLMDTFEAFNIFQINKLDGTQIMLKDLLEIWYGYIEHNKLFELINDLKSYFLTYKDEIILIESDLKEATKDKLIGNTDSNLCIKKIKKSLFGIIKLYEEEMKFVVLNDK